ncbi:homeobox protein 13-like [Panonychus citri]|uniref:homeobox protein 13-like n=1 Tax=Panonychus citri TaxID=50023 RepID=UPI00230784B2|nr:homeobox protein 13-like [Panonychus citri]
MLLISSSLNNKHQQQHTIKMMIIIIMLSVLTVNSSIIGSNRVSNDNLNENNNNNFNSLIGSSINNNQTFIDNPTNTNQNQSLILELRERKRKERLSLIKSSILSQLNLPVGHQHHHQHNVNHQPDDEMKVNHNQPCYLTKTERNILSDIFIMIRKTPEGTIDINEFSTNQQIIDKLQGLNTNSLACVRTAIFASVDHQRNSNTNSTLTTRSNFFPINSSSFSSSAVIGHPLFDQSNLSNKSLSDYQNDNATQQLILEQRQRRKQERLIFIQQQILSRLGLAQRTNETLPPCKLTDSERSLVDQVFNSKSSESNSNQLTQSNIVFTKLQGFHPSCRLNVTPVNPNQHNNSVPS